VSTGALRETSLSIQSTSDRIGDYSTSTSEEWEFRFGLSDLLAE
jgi:hypothetical protein